MKHQADSISYDAQKIAKYQADSHFDYNSQFESPDSSWFDNISKWFNRLLNTIFSGEFEESVTAPILICLFVTAILVILFLLFYKRPKLFIREKKTVPVPYSIEEENIHVIDFNKDIADALEKDDNRLAIRLLYLQTLRLLSDEKLIDWQTHKTPTDYFYEIKNADIKPQLLKLTNHFLRVRYGNYNASHELYEEMYDLQSGIKKIMEGGVNET